MNFNTRWLILLIAALALWLVAAPPRWWLNLTKPVDLSNPAATGAALVVKYECQSCHRLAGIGALKGPALDGVTQRLDGVALRLWLRDPRAIKGDTAMPKFRLSDSEVEALVAYLATLEP